MIEIRSHTNASELISLTGVCLERNESENNLPIGLAYSLAKDPYFYGARLPLLLSILEQEKAVGVAIMTPPHRIILSRIETNIQIAIVHLSRYLYGMDVQVPGVVGPATEAQAFSDYWVKDLRSLSSRVARQSRVFEARNVADLPLSQGKLRLARMEDHLLMAQWIAAFSEEIDEPINPDSAKNQAEWHIKARQLYIWDLGEPVSIAAAARPTRNGITINSVYTPSEHRSKGYATSCVLSLTKKLLSDGYAFCSLYTDISNPTSNSIYTKIGYVPVGDALSFDFVSSDSLSEF